MKTNTGQYGETIAAQHLQAQGYHILARNWRCVYGEIDIIAQKDQVIAFVEVRTRHANTTEAAFASLTASKQSKMRLAALHYLQAVDLSDTIWRIDVIGIALQHKKGPQIMKIDHVEDALGWE